ncbi:MAG TPA: hypothetical protein VJL37_09090 [Flavobacterium sp.]|nr:hypothetical protein [Flavobacterium sp.]
MLKNILNLKGAQQLSNNEQKEIGGGAPPIGGDIITCPRCADGTPPAYPTGTVSQCKWYCII